MKEWWILVSYPGDKDIPRAIGPYPSHEMCRLAGRNLMPTERRFFTDAEREEAEAADKVREEADRVRMEARAKLVAEKTRGLRGQWVKIDEDGSVYVNEQGVVDAWSMNASIVGSWGPIEPTPITGCVEIDRTSQPEQP